MKLPIYSERLDIRHPTTADAEGVHQAKLAQWDKLAKWMSWASEEQKTLQATQNFVIEASQPNYEDGQFKNLFLCAFERKSGDFCIATGFHVSDYCQENELELGYWISPKYEGQGLTTESTAALVRFGFEELGVSSLTINHFEGNAASQRVIEKLGFKFTEIRKQKHPISGDEINVRYYRMTSRSELLVG